MSTALACVAAVILDRLLGEPPRWHPLVGFGRIAEIVEAVLHPGANAENVSQRAAGVLSCCLLLLPIAWAVHVLEDLPGFGWLLGVGILYLTLGGQSLRQHALAVEAALSAGELQRGRERVGRMVSRDTAGLEPGDISKATIESVLENGCDAVFGALLWYLVAGAPGAVLYRLANTLDAMWGYRNERYLDFGWGAARLDDLLNWAPSRLTALSYAAVGSTAAAVGSWRRQGRQWKSRNAGTVMAAGAAALGLRLGGEASYEGNTQNRPPLGEGRAPEPADIRGALDLLDRALVLWLVLILVADLIFD